MAQKRFTLNFNMDNEESRLTYGLLGTLGKQKSRVIAQFLIPLLGKDCAGPGDATFADLGNMKAALKTIIQTDEDAADDMSVETDSSGTSEIKHIETTDNSKTTETVVPVEENIQNEKTNAVEEPIEEIEADDGDGYINNDLLSQLASFY